MCRLRGRCHPIRGETKLIDRVVGVTGEILNRATGQSGLHCQLNRLRNADRIIGEAVLHVSGDRKFGCRDDRRGVSQCLLASDRAVQLAQGGGKSTAGGCQRLVSKRGEDASGTGVPRVRDQQRRWAGVKLKKVSGSRGSVRLVVSHRATLATNRPVSC
jgi:hypothetical protein